MSDALKWYVIRVVGGQENKIKESIKVEITRSKLDSFVEELLIPRERFVQLLKGKKVHRERAYFPGYIMLKADLSGEVPHVIKAVSGVVGFLGETKGGIPVPLRNTEVSRMLGKADELAEKANAAVIPYSVGETVLVTDGPFNGFQGIIETVNEEKQKVEIMVKIFGRKTPLELSYSQISKV